MADADPPAGDEVRYAPAGVRTVGDRRLDLVGQAPPRNEVEISVADADPPAGDEVQSTPSGVRTVGGHGLDLVGQAPPRNEVEISVAGADPPAGAEVQSTPAGVPVAGGHGLDLMDQAPPRNEVEISMADADPPASAEVQSTPAGVPVAGGHGLDLMDQAPPRNEVEISMADADPPASAEVQSTPAGVPARGLCTDCGVSRTAEPKRCGRACQFIKPDYPGLETLVHGRARDPEKPDELFFGPFKRMVQARLRAPSDGAQWTGIATRLGERLLETGKVDAVIAMKPDPDDRWKPQPALITEASDMAGCRGMRMGYAPLFSLVEPARDAGHRRLAIIGIPCQVYALRALEAELGLDELYVIGTPCSDNTTTEHFHEFLALLSDRPETITYLEFRADYRVELRFSDGRIEEIPFLKLPISKLSPDFFPLTCRTCVDYTNALADITVGYMGGRGDQWLLVRNERGEQLIDLLGDEVDARPPTTAGKRTGPVQGFIKNVERAAGGLPLRAMPDWLRPLMGWLMPKIGPRGLEFARARLEMKAAETVLHLRREKPARMRSMIPEHVWRLVKPYGLSPKEGECKEEPRPDRR